MNMNTFIYILSCDSIKNRYKIGRHKGDYKSLINRYITPIPDLTVNYMYAHDDVIIEEKRLHDLLSKYRMKNKYNNLCEWFICDLSLILKNIHHPNVISDVSKASTEDVIFNVDKHIFKHEYDKKMLDRVKLISYSDFIMFTKQNDFEEIERCMMYKFILYHMMDIKHSISHYNYNINHVYNVYIEKNKNDRLFKIYTSEMTLKRYEHIRYLYSLLNVRNSNFNIKYTNDEWKILCSNIDAGNIPLISLMNTFNIKSKAQHKEKIIMTVVNAMLREWCNGSVISKTKYKTVNNVKQSLKTYTVIGCSFYDIIKINT